MSELHEQFSEQRLTKKERWFAFLYPFTPLFAGFIPILTLCNSDVMSAILYLVPIIMVGCYIYMIVQFTQMKKTAENIILHTLMVILLSGIAYGMGVEMFLLCMY